MKKILLLGGSSQQVVAITTAKRLGYYTILLDYLPDNPGQFFADEYYPISTTDKDAVLRVAQQSKIDGIIAYASDPAAPTAAYVAEKMSLPTNPLNSVNTLCNKDQFRHFLKENCFNAPESRVCKDYNIDISGLTLPVIVKPIDSSGSKGTTVIKSWEYLQSALKYAFLFSRSHSAIVEEYIEKKHNYLVGGDIFINNGEIKLWGLLNCHRDMKVNALVPVGKSYPLELDDSDVRLIKNEIERLVHKLQIKFGSINIELIVDNNNEVWLLDVGPRAGGNLIPELLSIIFNVDLVELAIKASMGEILELNTKDMISQEKNVFFASHNLQSDKIGKLDRIQFDSNLDKKIIEKKKYKSKGNDK